MSMRRHYLKVLSILLCCILVFTSTDITAMAGQKQKQTRTKRYLVKYRNGTTRQEDKLDGKKKNKKIKKFKKAKSENIYFVELEEGTVNEWYSDPEIERIEEDAQVCIMEEGIPDGPVSDEFPLPEGTSLHEGAEDRVLCTCGSETCNPGENTTEDCLCDDCLRKRDQEAAAAEEAVNSGLLTGTEGYVNEKGDRIPWNIARVQAQLLHQKGILGDGVKVAVLDTGISTAGGELRIAGGVSFVEGAAGYQDDNGHGTKVAGILAAAANGESLAGIAPGIELYAVKVLDQNGEGRYSNVIQGIDWAIEQGMDIIVLSLGGTADSSILHEAMVRASEHNILVAAASGNGGTDRVCYPAAYREVLAVGATDSDNRLSGLSCYGEQLDITAPGEEIETIDRDGTVTVIRGTSAAVPLAAGAAALLKGERAGLTNGQLKYLLKQNAVAMADSYLYGSGILDVQKAYQDMLEDDYTIPMLTEEGETINIPAAVDVGGDGILTAAACCSCSGCYQGSASYHYAEHDSARGGHRVVYYCGKASCRSIHEYSCVYPSGSYTSVSSCCKCAHSYGAYKTTKAATCTADGTRQRKCTRCGYTVTGTIPKLGHSYGAYQVTKAATCSAAGTEKSTCTRCSAARTRSIALTAHSWGNYTVTKEATCVLAGEKKRVCKNNSAHTETEPVAVDPGNHKHLTTGVYVNCNGSSHLRYWKCTDCWDLIYKDTVSCDCGPAHSHSYTKVYDEHTGKGHQARYVCTCGSSYNGDMEVLQDCLLCTTAPSASLVNLSSDTILTEKDTAFRLQVKVQDNSNAVLTCRYYLDNSPVANGGYSGITNTLRPQTITIYSTINAANLAEGRHSLRLEVYKEIGPSTTITVNFMVSRTSPSLTNPQGVPVIVTRNISSATFKVSARSSVGLHDKAYRYTVGNMVSDWVATYEYTVTDLTPNTKYTYKIEVRDKVNHITSTIAEFYTKPDYSKVSVQPFGDGVELLIDDDNPFDTEYYIIVQSPDYYLYLSKWGLNTTKEAYLPSRYKDTDLKRVGMSFYRLGVNKPVTIKACAKSKYSSNEDALQNHYVSAVSGPAKPEGFSVINNTKSGIKLRWNAVSGAASYELKRNSLDKNNIITDRKVISDIYTNTYEDTDIKVGQSYQYYLISKNSGGISCTGSTSVQVSSYPAPPAMVGGITGTYGSSMLNLTWNQVDGAIGYEIVYSKDGNVRNEASLYSENPECHIPVEGPDSQYLVHIRAFNMGDGSNRSDYTKWENPGVPSQNYFFYTPANLPELKEIQSENITTQSIKTEWNTNGNPESVSYCLGVFQNDMLVKQSVYQQGNTGTITGLMPKTAYTLKVRARNSAGQETEWSEGIEIMTRRGIPKAPQNLRATSRSDEIILAWDMADRADYYQIRRDGLLLADHITEFSYKDTSVAYGTSYTYQVQAVNEDGGSEWSIPITKKSLGEMPKEPEGLTAEEQELGAIIRWNTVGGATGYDLEINGTLYNMGTETRYEHSGLLPGSVQTYRIRTRNISGKSPFSQPVTLVIRQAAPSIPDGIMTFYDQTGLHVIWNSAERAQYYDIEINGSVYESVEAAEYVYSPAEGETGCTVRIRSGNASGASDWSVMQQINYETGTPSLPYTAPDTPSGLTGTTMSNAITLSWNPAGRAAYYELEADNEVVYSGASCVYTHIQTEAGREYTYRVRAVNSAGAGEWGESCRIQAEALYSSIVEDISVIRESGDIINVFWNPVPGAEGYRIMLNGEALDTIAEGNQFSLAVQPDTACQLQIAAIIPRQDTEWSPEFTFTAPGIIPVPKDGEVSMEVTEEGLMVTWVPLEGVTGYEVEVNGTLYDAWNQNQFLINWVDESSEYECRVRGYRADGAGAFSGRIKMAYDKNVTGAPLAIITKNIEENGKKYLVIDWAPVEGAVSYEVDMGEVHSAEEPSYRLENPASGQQYTFRVRAVLDSGYGPWSRDMICYADLGAVTGIQIIERDQGRYLVWDDMDNAEGYEIELNGECYGTALLSEQQLTGISSYLTCIIRVRAYNGGMQGEWSEPYLYSPEQTVPVEVTMGEEFSIVLPASNVTDISSYSMSLMWKKEELMLLDACEATAWQEIISQYIPEYQMQITVDTQGDMQKLSIYVKDYRDMAWTGVLDSIRVKSKINGTAEILYKVTYLQQ